jgi:hypothetical protein
MRFSHDVDTIACLYHNYAKIGRTLSRVYTSPFWVYTSPLFMRGGREGEMSTLSSTRHTVKPLNSNLWALQQAAQQKTLQPATMHTAIKTRCAGASLISALQVKVCDLCETIF